MSSVLETFLILFSTNSDDVKKGTEEAGKSVDKLEEKIKSTDTVSHKLGMSFMDMAKSLGGVVAGYVALSSVSSFIADSTRYADKIDEMSGALGIAAEDLGAWGQAVKQSGGTMESFSMGVKNLSMRLSDLKAGKKEAKVFFDQMGVSATDAHGKMKPVMQLLPEIAEAFEKLSKEESFALGAKIGLDEGTIKLLQTGRKAVDDLVQRQKDFGTVSKKSAEETGKLYDALDDLLYSMRITAANAFGTIAPLLRKILEGITEIFSFLKDNSRFVITALGAIAAGLLALAAPALLSGLASLAKLILAVNLPLVAIGAAITALLMLFEDWWAWMEGAPSAFKPLWDSLSKLGDMFEKVLSSIRAVKNELWSLAKFGTKDMAATIGFTRDLFRGEQKVDSAKFWQMQNAGNVSVGNITVNTQATDAEGISKAIGATLTDQLKSTQAAFATGEK